MAESKYRTKKLIQEEGNLAMAIISDYPLYASTSGITYEEAIAVAKALYPKQSDYQDALKEAKELNI